MGKSNNPRPLLVTLFAILNILIGLAAILVGGLTFTGLTIIGGIEIGALAGGSSVVAGLIYILIGVGFLCGWSIMWYLGIIFAALAIELDALSLLRGELLAKSAPDLAESIILYLFKPNVKRYFLE